MATIRSIISQSAPYASSDFINGLSAAGIAVDAPVPMKPDGNERQVPVMTTALLIETFKDIGEFLRTNQKIQAIKVLRERTGLGLKETKDIIDIFPSAARPPY